MYQFLHIKSFVLLSFWGVGLLFHGAQAASDAQYVEEIVTVSGEVYLSTTSAATQIFIAKDEIVCGIEHFNQTKAPSSIIFIKENTLVKNWDQVFEQKSTEPEPEPKAPAANDRHKQPLDHQAHEESKPKVSNAEVKEKQPTRSPLPFHPNDKPKHQATVAAAANSANTPHKYLSTTYLFNKSVQNTLQKPSFHYNTYKKNRHRPLQWFSKHTNQPPPFA